MFGYNPLAALVAPLKEPKVEKTIKSSEKMFKAIKEAAGPVSQVLESFISAGAAKDVFSTVVDAYSGYLSDVFWGQILNAINWDSITSVITDVLGPFFEEIGGIIATGLESVFEAAPFGASLGAVLGSLIGSIWGPLVSMIGGLLGAGLGALIELLYVGLEDAINAIMDWIFKEYGRTISEEVDWADVLGPILPELEPEPEYEPERPPHGWVEAQKGGIFTRPTFTHLAERGKPEGVFPLDEFYSKFDEFVYQQEKTNELLAKIWREKEFRHR